MEKGFRVKVIEIKDDAVNVDITFDLSEIEVEVK